MGLLSAKTTSIFFSFISVTLTWGWILLWATATFSFWEGTCSCHILFWVYTFSEKLSKIKYKMKIENSECTWGRGRGNFIFLEGGRGLSFSLKNFSWTPSPSLSVLFGEVLSEVGLSMEVADAFVTSIFSLPSEWSLWSLWSLWITSPCDEIRTIEGSHVVLIN